MITPSSSPRKIIPSKDSLSTVDLNAEESKNISEKESTITQLSVAMSAAMHKGKHYQFFSWQTKKNLLRRNQSDFLENPSIDTLIQFILTAKKQRAPKLSTSNCTKSIKYLTDCFKEIPDLAQFIQNLPDEMSEDNILLLRKELFIYFPELNINILNWRFK